MNLGTLIYTFLYGKLVGSDEFENRYYCNSSNFNDIKSKRWVIFSKEIDLKDYYKTEVGMTEDRIRKIFEEIGSNKASFTLNVGNEPLQAPQFKMCVTELKKYGHTGTINTNGLLLNEDMCKFLVEQQFDSVSISVDAVTKESLKRIRGITAIDKIIRNVKRLVEIRGSNALPRIAVSFVVLPFNTKEIPEFLDWRISYGISWAWHV